MKYKPTNIIKTFLIFLQFEETLAEETVVEETVEETLAEETLAEETVVEETVEETLAEETLAEETVEETLVEETERKSDEELPSKYNDNEWCNDFTIESGKYINKNNKMYIFSSYVEKKYLHNNCGSSHGDFTNCFLELVNDNSTPNDDGIKKFNQKKMLDILKEINCRLYIRDSLQRVKLSVLRIDDIIDIL